MADIAARLSTWSDRPSPFECWPWKGATKRDGYGRISVGHSRRALAHRISYEVHVGPIPAGMELDHRCRNRACINPAHLEPVTHRENALRGLGAAGLNRRKVSCKNGHAFDEANTYWELTHYGTRVRRCRRCNRESHARSTARLRG